MADIYNGQMANYIARDFFVYELDFASVANGASANASFNVQSDSDFLWTAGTFAADLAAAAVTDSGRIIPLMNVLITDTGSGRQLMNAAVPIPSIFGVGQLPFILPRQRLFRSNTTVNVVVSNYSSATTYNLKLSFIGEKAFKG